MLSLCSHQGASPPQDIIDVSCGSHPLDFPSKVLNHLCYVAATIDVVTVILLPNLVGFANNGIFVVGLRQSVLLGPVMPVPEGEPSTTGGACLLRLNAADYKRVEAKFYWGESASFFTLILRLDPPSLSFGPLQLIGWYLKLHSLFHFIAAFVGGVVLPMVAKDPK